jgi:hypothetical protein
MDFLNKLKEHIEGLPFTPSTVHVGLYDENGNSVAIRPAPSNIDERYMEDGKIYPFSFQILMHHSSNLFAYDSLEQLTSELDNLDPRAITSSNGSFSLVSLQCTTTPNFVEKTSYGTLWTAIYQADLHIKGGN